MIWIRSLTPPPRYRDFRFAPTSGGECARYCRFKPIRYGGVSRLMHFVGRFGIVPALTAAVLLLPTPEGLSDKKNEESSP